MNKVLAALVISLAVASVALGQTRVAIFAGTDIPLTYNLGVQVRLGQHWSVSSQVGLLAAPYDRAIVGIAEAFGLSDTLGRAIESAFQQGIGVGLSVGYHFGHAQRHHVRLSGQYLGLSGANTAVDLLESALNRSFSSLRTPQVGVSAPLAVQLTCDLWLVGAYYGYSFPLGSSDTWSLRVEAGFAKVISSSNAFSSNRPRLDGTNAVKQLYADLDSDLRTTFSDYGYAPSLNVHVMYTFGGHGYLVRSAK
jgi:hypothetical protein